MHRKINPYEIKRKSIKQSVVTIVKKEQSNVIIPAIQRDCGKPRESTVRLLTCSEPICSPSSFTLVELPLPIRPRSFIELTLARPGILPACA